jgi:CrcB protein
MLQGYQAFSNYDRFDRNGLHDTVDGLAYSFVTFGMGLATLALGEHIASLCTFAGKPSHRQTPKLDLLAVISAGLSYAIALIIYFKAPRQWRHDVTFSLLLAPPGAMLRFFLAKLNAKPQFQNRFPLGTFIANLSATLLLAGAFSASHSTVNATSCNALNAIQQGFCGCLSTVSTFCVEVRSIKGRRWTWGYVFASVVFGHLCVLFVVGGVGWSGEGGLGKICEG